jgi:hypothetical protein
MGQTHRDVLAVVLPLPTGRPARADLSAVNHTWPFAAQPLPSFEMTRTFDIQAPMGVLAARSGSAI